MGCRNDNQFGTPWRTRSSDLEPHVPTVLFCGTAFASASKSVFFLSFSFVKYKKVNNRRRQIKSKTQGAQQTHTTEHTQKVIDNATIISPTIYCTSCSLSIAFAKLHPSFDALRKSLSLSLPNRTHP